jgi:lipopolysaccharide transport system ATP-binding protein
MSSERAPAIRVRGLGKRYRVGALQSRHNTLRDHLAGAAREAWTRAGRALRRGEPRAAETIWALRNIDLDVAPGEAVGIIGGNGAGKSTLLKLLSRITQPTEGHGVIRGRIGSLLEVGTGFHSELTGRENTFLNGAILGMRRTEIARKFDSIVDFAGVERFIDTPVKFYSSGMYLRLAFAVAAHMDPDILVVDEVLAVGDQEFRARCIQKMRSISREDGRTVLFVSHDMNALRRLCDRCLLLRSGALVEDGETNAVIAHHLSDAGAGAMPARWIELVGIARGGSGEARFRAVRYRGGREDVGYAPSSEGPLLVQVAVESDVRREVASLAVTIDDPHGGQLVNMDSALVGGPIALEAGRNTFTIRAEALHLRPGSYTMGLWLADERSAPLDHLPIALHLEVVPGGGADHPARVAASGVVSCDFRVTAGAEASEDPGGRDPASTPGTRTPDRSDT